MKSYFLEYAETPSGVEETLDNLLPAQRRPWVLHAPDGHVIASFIVGILRQPQIASDGQTVQVWREPEADVQVDISERSELETSLALGFLRAVREQAGGLIIDSDGGIVD